MKNEFLKGEEKYGDLETPTIWRKKRKNESQDDWFDWKEKEEDEDIQDWAEIHCYQNLDGEWEC